VAEGEGVAAAAVVEAEQARVVVAELPVDKVVALAGKARVVSVAADAVRERAATVKADVVMVGAISSRT